MVLGVLNLSQYSLNRLFLNYFRKYGDKCYGTVVTKVTFIAFLKRVLMMDVFNMSGKIPAMNDKLIRCVTMEVMLGSYVVN